ncbi:MAG: TraB/GumN family protein [Sphingomonas fennica]
MAGRDTTIWLFGTVHVLPANQRWLEGRVAAAFDASDEVAIETIAPPPAEAAAIVRRLSVDPAGRTLPAIVGPALTARLRGALTAAHRPPEMLDAYEPWYAASLLTFVALDGMGIAPGSGVEPALTARAAAQGKPVIGLEGFEQQLRILDGLPEADQRAMLADTLDELADAEGEIKPMMAAWARGDAAHLARLMNDGLKDLPHVRRVLLTERNVRFAGWVAERLKRPGTAFLAVGAGHLGGADSVQAFLGKRGITVQRVQ